MKRGIARKLKWLSGPKKISDLGQGRKWGGMKEGIGGEECGKDACPEWC
jgi:hypothetical protein